MVRNLLVAALCSVTMACTTMPPDLREYLDEVRAEGMTEDARGSLYSVASIKTGGTVLMFPKDEVTGSYGMSFRSTRCPAPGVDPEEWQAVMKEEQAKIEAEMAVLKPIADTDRSGFVSSAEGWRLRSAMELGAQAAFIFEDVGHDRDKLLQAMNLSEEQLQKRLTEYHYYLDLLPSYQQEPFVWPKIAQSADDDP